MTGRTDATDSILFVEQLFWLPGS